MSEAPIPTIPSEAVDLAARALWADSDTGFDALIPIDQHAAREEALAALNAVAPVLYRTWKAQFWDELADELAGQLCCGPDPEPQCMKCGQLHGEISACRARAAELRGSTENQPSSEPERKWKTINPLEWPVRVGPSIVGGGCELGLACSVAAQQSAERRGVVHDVYDPDGNIVTRYRDGVELRGSTDV